MAIIKVQSKLLFHNWIDNHFICLLNVFCDWKLHCSIRKLSVRKGKFDVLLMSLKGQFKIPSKIEITVETGDDLRPHCNSRIFRNISAGVI